MYCIEHSTVIVRVCSVLTDLVDQQLTDRIRELCAKAIALPDSTELNDVLKELNAALSEHTRRLRNMAVGARFTSQLQDRSPGGG